MPDTPPLTPADPADLAGAILYALRRGLTGKPHGARLRDDPEGMARAVVAHLARSNFHVFCGPPVQPHSTSSVPHDGDG